MKIGSFGGRDRSRILDSKEITSYLPMAVEQTMVQIGRMTATAIEIHGARHVPRPAYPAAALREAVTNAVVHADYSQHGTPITISLFSDRIEVENPGLLPFGLTLEDIRDGTSKLRNRVIGRVFKELRLIEQWGSGIQRMTEACRDAGLAAPLLEERAMGFRVTILSAPEGPARIRALDAEVLEVLEQRAGSGGASTSEIAHAIRRSDRATLTRLKTLLDRGLVVRVGSSRTDPGARWLPSKP